MISLYKWKFVETELLISCNKERVSVDLFVNFRWNVLLGGLIGASRIFLLIRNIPAEILINLIPPDDGQNCILF